MHLRFECECGEEISEFTRGAGESHFRLECSGCGAVYAVSLTQLTETAHEPDDPQSTSI